MRAPLLQVVMFAVALCGCPKKDAPQATADPTPKASASASTVASAVPSNSAQPPSTLDGLVCVDGTLTGASPFGDGYPPAHGSGSGGGRSKTVRSLGTVDRSGRRRTSLGIDPIHPTREEVHQVELS